MKLNDDDVGVTYFYMLSRQEEGYDHSVNFSEQRESLLSRKNELEVSAKKVMEVIDSLDKQKDEAINWTFRGVSAHFKDVFKELVPNGAGELIRLASTRTRRTDEDDELDQEEEEGQGCRDQAVQGRFNTRSAP
jgi:structural maintenance of chromosome 3 (chondroitin sulfate proteoglycan 6)